MAVSRNLFEIGDELNRIAEAFDVLDSQEQSDDVMQTVEDYFGNLLDERDDKIDRYGSLIRWFEQLAQSASEEAKRLSALATVRENAAKRLKERLKDYFETEGISKFSTARFSFSVAQNGGKVPLVFVEEFNAGRLPEHFRETFYKPNSDVIREALESGDEVAGVTLGERGTHLRMK
jgi:hypothetical protein